MSLKSSFAHDPVPNKWRDGTEEEDDFDEETDLDEKQWSLMEQERRESRNMQEGMKTIEIRSLRSQLCFREFLVLIRMFTAKVDVLRCSLPKPKLVVPEYLDPLINQYLLKADLYKQYRRRIREYFTNEDVIVDDADPDLRNDSALPEEVFYEGNQMKDKELEGRLDKICEEFGPEELKAYVEGIGFDLSELKGVCALNALK